MKQEQSNRRTTKKMWEYFSYNPPDFLGITAMLNAGADPNSCDKEGRPLLFLMLERNAPLLPEETAAMRVMIDKGARLNGPYGASLWSPLHFAMAWGKTERVQFLLDLGADPNVVDKQGKTALFDIWLSRDIPLQKVFMLWDAGADLKHKNHEGRTTFHYWPAEFHNNFLRYASRHERMADIKQLYWDVYPSLPEEGKAIWDQFIDGVALRRSETRKPPDSAVTRYLAQEAAAAGGRTRGGSA